MSDHLDPGLTAGQIIAQTPSADAGYEDLNTISTEGSLDPLMVLLPLRCFPNLKVSSAACLAAHRTIQRSLARSISVGYLFCREHGRAWPSAITLVRAHCAFVPFSAFVPFRRSTCVSSFGVSLLMVGTSVGSKSDQDTGTEGF
jgi:hypothetical protein